MSIEVEPVGRRRGRRVERVVISPIGRTLSTKTNEGDIPKNPSHIHLESAAYRAMMKADAKDAIRVMSYPEGVMDRD